MTLQDSWLPLLHSLTVTSSLAFYPPAFPLHLQNLPPPVGMARSDISLSRFPELSGFTLPPPYWGVLSMSSLLLFPSLILNSPYKILLNSENLRGLLQWVSQRPPGMASPGIPCRRGAEQVTWSMFVIRVCVGGEGWGFPQEEYSRSAWLISIHPEWTPSLCRADGKAQKRDRRASALRSSSSSGADGLWNTSTRQGITHLRGGS